MWIRAAVVLLVAAVATVSWLATCVLSHYQEVAAGVAPLELREFEELTVVTVGTGGAYENPSRLGPAIAVGLGTRVVLVDAGRAVAEGLRQAKIPLRQIESVWLTSLLPENVVGLDDLQLTGWLRDRPGPLRVLGPPGTRDLARALVSGHAPAAAALAAAIGLPAEGARIEAVEVEAGFSESLDGIEVRVTAQAGGPLPARGYRFEAGGRSLFVSSAGWDPEALVAGARGADLWVHEALHGRAVELTLEVGADQPERLRREAALHTHVESVGELARRAGVASLVLVRLRPPPLFARQLRSEVGRSFAGRIVVAEDGQAITP